MSPIRTARPYAAKAIIQHDWDTNHLNVWVTFRFAMDQTVKPAHNLWLCEADGVPKAVTVSAWQDEWTILLTVPDILALPGTVTLEYDGPSEDLRITWDKQWEPWGPILSIRVPYLWEDILVVDTVLKRVGIQPGVVAAAAFAYALTIVSPDGNDQVGLYIDNLNAYLKWTDGVLYLETDEGTNTTTRVRVRGKGTGYGVLEVYDQDNAEWATMTCQIGRAFFGIFGSAPVALELQNAANVPVRSFSGASEGETEPFEVYGFRAGDIKRALSTIVGGDAANSVTFSGLLDYLFSGNIKATGRISSNTLTHSLLGPTDDLDVSGVNTVFIDAAANNVIIGGFVGGINGQILYITKVDHGANSATLENEEAGGNQDIHLHAEADETLINEHGGWVLACDGSGWYDTSHAKHV